MRITPVTSLLTLNTVTLLLGIFLILLSSIAAAEPIKVTTKAIELVEGQPAKLTVGQLRYRGGLVISSSASGFGGLSALGVSTDGNRMIALTDKGRRFAAQLIYSNDGNLVGITRTQLDTLARLDGAALKAKSEADIECMSPGVEGEIIVGFERRHRLWRYLPGKIIPEPISQPDELSGLPPNSGLEGLSLLADGRLFAIAEGPENFTSTLAWVSDPNGWSMMTYTLNGGFRPSGAVTLSDGDILVLERRFTLRDGVAGRIRRINSANIEPAATLNPTLVAEFRDPVVTDNFEGIAVRSGSNQNTLVYIVSDDNFNPMQRTLLLMFELKN